MNDKNSNKIKERINLLKRQINEYEKLEKYFGTDKKGNIVYDEYRDQELALDNLKNGNSYVGLFSFIEWIDSKTKEEIMYDLDSLLNENNKETKIKTLNPSSEQKAIIHCVSIDKNVMVDAVAGSGKTTTVMFIAKHNPKKKILQITYNKQLKNEVREKVQNAGIENLEIHTYHSLAVKYYDKNCYTDDNIIKVLSNNDAPKTLKKYDILIIDEVQDMTPNYYSLVCKFINDMDLKNSTFLVLGDRYQGVYDFKNADIRFLIFFDKIWNNGQSFTKLPMQESYRVTKQIAWFVNNAMIGQERIVSNKDSNHKVYYYRKNKFMIHYVFAQKISELMKMGYKSSDFFILAPSLKSNNSKNPLKKLENKLVEMKIPVYYARNEEEGLDDKIIEGKIVFSTYHQSKGRERKVTIVFGFDNSYFKFYNKNKNSKVCPSELYVATTRASEILILFEADDEPQLEFMQLDHANLRASGFVDFIGNIPKEIKEKNLQSDDVHKTSASEITNYISEENNEKLIDLLSKIFISKTPPLNKYTIDIPSNIKTKNGRSEDVSDINGLVLPAMYENRINGSSTLQKIINDMYENADTGTRKIINSVLNTKVKEDNIEKFLCMGNLYIALNEKIHSKLSQIDSYDWLTNEMVKVCHKNLKNNINDSPVFEIPLGDNIREDGTIFFHYNTNLFGDIEITARVDCIDKNTLWEFKCVSILSNDNLLQLVVYSWIWEKCMKNEHGQKKFKILNLRTGEVKQLKYESYYVEEIMSILFENKYYKKPKDEDKIFIEKCNKIRNKIYKSVNKPIEKSLFDFGFGKTKKDTKESNVFDNDSNDCEECISYSFGSLFKTKLNENNDETPKKNKKCLKKEKN